MYSGVIEYSSLLRLKPCRSINNDILVEVFASVFMVLHLDFFDTQMEAVSSCETLVTIYKMKQSRFQENVTASLLPTAYETTFNLQNKFAHQRRKATYHSTNNKAAISNPSKMAFKGRSKHIEHSQSLYILVNCTPF